MGREMTGNVFIYALCPPDDFLWQEIRYVGATMNLTERLLQHMTPTRLAKTDNPALTTWLKTLKAQKLKPVTILLEIVPSDSWRVAEQKWITFLKAQGANLTNISPGGAAWSEASRLKYRSSWTPERRQKKAGELRQLWATPEFAQKMAQQKARESPGRKPDAFAQEADGED